MKIRVGIIGYKNGGKAHYSELRRSDKFEVFGIYEEGGVDDYCRAEVFANFSQFITQTNPELLIICLDENDVFNAFSQSVKYCKNILISGAICKNPSQLAQMKYLANQSGANVMLDFSMRFNAAFISLKNALKKEEEIFSVDVFNARLQSGVNIVNAASLCDVDLVFYLLDAAINSSSLSLANKTNQKSADNALIKMTFKNQTLVSIINSLTTPVMRHTVIVNSSGGMYFCDLNGLRLHKMQGETRINLKVDADISATKILYDEVYCKINNTANSAVAGLDDAMRAYEILTQRSDV